MPNKNSKENTVDELKATIVGFENGVFNVKPDPIDMRDKIFEPGLTELKSVIYPKSVLDLGLTVRQQYTDNSCTGQALAAVIDLQNIKHLDAGADVPEMVSARMLYNSARAYDHIPGEDDKGSSIRGAIKGFFHRGVCGKNKEGVNAEKWVPTRDSINDAKRVSLGAYFRLRHELNSYHVALAETGAILCSAIMHEGWSPTLVNQNDGKIIEPANSLQGGAGAEVNQNPRGHAFAIVGYDHEGFIVLNSFGSAWGRFKYKKDRPINPEDEDKGLPGMAHWNYEDWAKHVIDAWVLRLQVPSVLGSGYIGGYYKDRISIEQANPGLEGKQISTSRVSGIRGHFIHIDEGKLVSNGPYDNDLNSFAETVEWLNCEKNKEKYDHIVFFAHGGLNTLKDASATANRLVEGFKRNKIFPIFIFWRTGLWNIIGDLVGNAFKRLLSRTGGSSSFTDLLIEAAVAAGAKPIWGKMVSDAELCFNKDLNGNGGEGWEAIELLINGLMLNNNSHRKIHFMGHSAGAILLANFFKKAEQNLKIPKINMGTVSLLAPACTHKLFKTHYFPVIQKMPDRNDFAIYNLTRKQEEDDNVVGAYQKSLLHLISAALEDVDNEKLVGLDRGWEHLKNSTIDIENKHNSAKLADSIQYHLSDIGEFPASKANNHGAFDNDATTLNHILDRILKSDSISNPKYFSASEVK